MCWVLLSLVALPIELPNLLIYLVSSLTLRILGHVNYFLGLQVNHDIIDLHIHQLKYAHDLLMKFDMVSYKLASTPLAAKVALTATDSSLLVSPTFFAS